MKSSIFPASFLVRPSVDDPPLLSLMVAPMEFLVPPWAAWLFYGPEVEMRGLDHGEY